MPQHGTLAAGIVGALCCLSACAAAPIKPVTEFKANQLPTIEQSGGLLGYFDTGDGVKLRFARFPAVPVTAIGTVVLVTGRTQFIEVYLEQIQRFRQRGFDVWAMDWRGQGLSGGRLADRHKGHISSFSRYVGDLHHFRGLVVQPAAGPKVLVSQSMGGGVALRYLIDHPGLFDKAVLGAPLLGLAAPSWLVDFVAWQGKSSPEDYVLGEGGGYGAEQREFEDNPFTLDRKRFLRTHAYIDRTPALALAGPTKGWVRAAQIHSHELAKPEYASRLKTPVLMLAAEFEQLVDNDAQILLASRSPAIKRIVVPHTRHEIWLARDVAQARVWKEIDAFLGVSLATP